jgi:hypothetical protein
MSARYVRNFSLKIHNPAGKANLLQRWLIPAEGAHSTSLPGSTLLSHALQFGRRKEMRSSFLCGRRRMKEEAGVFNFFSKGKE